MPDIADAADLLRKANALNIPAAPAAAADAGAGAKAQLPKDVTTRAGKKS